MGPFHRLFVHKFLYRPAFQEMILNKVGNIFWLDLNVEYTFRVNHQHWTQGTKAIASRYNNFDFFFKTAISQFFFQGFFDLS